MKGRIVGSLLVWLAAVATVAGIATIAIGTAGRQVTSQPRVSPSPIAVPAPVQSTPVTDGGSPATVGRPAVEYEAQGDEAALGDLSARLVTQAVRADGGRVQARCRGPRVASYALPDDGWRARISSTAQHRLEVVFSLGSQRAVLVTAVCEQGAPAFRQTALNPRDPLPVVPGPGPGRPSQRPDPDVTEISPGPTPTGRPSAPENPSRPTPSGTAPPTSSTGTTAPGSPSPSRPPSTTTTSTSTTTTASPTAAPTASPSRSATRAPQDAPASSASSSYPSSAGDEPTPWGSPQDTPSVQCPESAAAVPEGEPDCGADGPNEWRGVPRSM